MAAIAKLAPRTPAIQTNPKPVDLRHPLRGVRHGDPCRQFRNYRWVGRGPEHNRADQRRVLRRRCPVWRNARERAAPGRVGRDGSWWQHRIHTEAHRAVRFGVDLTPPVDSTRPVLSLPTAMTVPTENPSGAIITYTASATNDMDGVVPVACTPKSGSVFDIGATIVECEASDVAGNTATGSFTVTVKDFVPGGTAVAAGREHSCAVLEDGTVSCWGGKWYGQLGDGTTDDSSIPVLVSGLH